VSYEPVTTVLSSAASYALTDLETVKDELSINDDDTSGDTWLTRAIAQVSKAIMNDTNRVFAPEYVQDAFDVRRARYQVPNGRRELQLSRWPVLAVASVTQILDTSDTPQALVQGTDFRVDFIDGALSRLDANTGAVTAWEALPVTVKYSAGFGLAVQETHTVPATPYEVTVAQAADFSCDQSVSYADGTLLTPVGADPALGQYTVAAGVYTFNVADTDQALTFAYCTEQVPDDLVDATLQLVTARFRAKGRDPALTQRDTPGIGTERFWFGGAPGQAGPFPPAIEGLLDNYRAPVVA
jgi:hypothetical protein